MITIQGYKNLSYRDFQLALHKALTDSEKSTLQVAAQINVKAEQTVKNSFRTDMQAVSDEVMTNVMKAVGLSGFVIWIFGTRYYYVKTK